MTALLLPRTGDGPQAGSHSLLARLMAVTHFIQKQTMDRLAQAERHGKLSVAYSDYFALLAERDQSPGELAERLGVSKQACSKMLRELERRGLIGRRPNPQDSRSSVLSLSPRGIAVLRDGIETSNAIQAQLIEALGAPRLPHLLGILDRLCVALAIETPAHRPLEDVVAAKIGSRPMRLGVVLPRLNKFLRQRLAASLNDNGFADVRPGVGPILGMLGRESRRLQYVASILGISKQAVAATAAELDEQGYVTRAEDPADRRQVLIALSPRGRELMREALASVAELEAAIGKALGDADYRLLDAAMTTFYLAITERYDSASALRSRIRQLSQQLTQELGVTGARALAQQLMTLTKGNP